MEASVTLGRISTNYLADRPFRHRKSDGECPIHAAPEHVEALEEDADTNAVFFCRKISSPSTTIMSLEPSTLHLLRPQLLRFAVLQLRNEAWAEDAVQETLAAALAHADQFAGQSSLKTYLIGILKHKIIDTLRARERDVLLDADGDFDEPFDAVLFDENGRYREELRTWGDPESTLEKKQFLAALEICVEALPPNLARVFMMREWLELDTKEICVELDIRPNNLWVMLYRARMRLRECLDLRWFGVKALEEGKQPKWNRSLRGHSANESKE